MASKNQHPSTASDKGGKDNDTYHVRVLNVMTGIEQDVAMPASAWRRAISLWPTYTIYIVGFALLGLSFIANTLRLYVVFVVLLTMAAGLVIGVATARFIRSRRDRP